MRDFWLHFLAYLRDASHKSANYLAEFARNSVA